MYCVYQNQIAAAYSFLYFIFPSLQFSNIKSFVTLLSGIVRTTKLRLGTHVDNGLMQCVYQNQAAAAYLSLHFFIFLSLQFSNIKSFLSLFISNCEAYKVGNYVHTWTMGRCSMYTGIRLLLLLYFFGFLSLQFYCSSFFCLSN